MYYTPHAITSTEMMRFFKPSHLRYAQGFYTKKYKADTKYEFVTKVFNYGYYLILLDIIENNVTFVLPTIFGRHAELYMETVEGEEFKKSYQRGAFQEIDFILSNFKAHKIVFSYENNYKLYKKNVFISHNLKNRIINYTNSGRVYDSPIIKKLTEYLDQIVKKFPDLTIQEAKKIITYGFKVMLMLHLYGMDTITKTHYFTAYIGELHLDSYKYACYTRKKHKKKLRFLFNRHKKVWDGYVYFGLTEADYKYYQSQAGKKEIHFPHVYLVKLEKEAYLDQNRKHFFRIKYDIKYWVAAEDDFITDRAEYISYRDVDGKIKYI